MIKFELVLQEARLKRKLNMVERQNLKRGGKAINKGDEKVEMEEKVEVKEEVEENNKRMVVQQNMVERQNLKRGGKAIRMEEAAEGTMENKEEENTREVVEELNMEELEEKKKSGVESKEAVALKREEHSGANFYSALSRFQIGLPADQPVMRVAVGVSDGKVQDVKEEENMRKLFLEEKKVEKEEEENIRRLFNVREGDVKGINRSTEKFDLDEGKKSAFSNAEDGANRPEVKNVEKVKVTPDFHGNGVGTNESWRPMSSELPGLFFTVKPLKRKLEESKGKTVNMSSVQKMKKEKSESILREAPIAFDLNASTQLVGETWCFKFRRYAGGEKIRRNKEVN